MKNTASNPYKNLYLIDLDQATLPGFRHFISSWVYEGASTNFIVDPGPSNTICMVIDFLNNRDIDKLDYILLTHIHLDHAGGTGDLLKEYPMAKVICHEKGIPHLINPEILYLRSIEVLGKLARTFGPLKPVPAENIFNTEKLNIPEGEILVFPTPGHAPHHQSFQFNDLIFCGEALGTTVPTTSDLYLRLATPQVFKFDIFENSMRKIEERKPDYLCMAHYGFINKPQELIVSAEEQLHYWLHQLSSFIEKSEKSPDPEFAFQFLIDNDPRLSAFNDLPADIIQRELYFSGNSMKGMIDYIEKKNRLEK